MKGKDFIQAKIEIIYKTIKQYEKHLDDDPEKVEKLIKDENEKLIKLRNEYPDNFI